MATVCLPKHASRKGIHPASLDAARLISAYYESAVPYPGLAKVFQHSYARVLKSVPDRKFQVLDPFWSLEEVELTDTLPETLPTRNEIHRWLTGFPLVDSLEGEANSEEEYEAFGAGEGSSEDSPADKKKKFRISGKSAKRRKEALSSEEEEAPAFGRDEKSQEEEESDPSESFKSDEDLSPKFIEQQIRDQIKVKEQEQKLLLAQLAEAQANPTPPQEKPLEPSMPAPKFPSMALPVPVPNQAGIIVHPESDVIRPKMAIDKRGGSRKRNVQKKPAAPSAQKGPKGKGPR